MPNSSSVHPNLRQAPLKRAPSFRCLRLNVMQLLIALLLASTQASNMSVSLSPMRAPIAIRHIALACGRRLAVAPALDEEILFVRLKDASVDSALAHISEVLCAKWVNRSNGITWLEPDPEALSKVEKTLVDADEARLLNSFKYLQKRLSQQPEELDQKAVDAYVQKKKSQDESIKDAEARRDYAHRLVGAPAGQESPAWRALARIVLQMDPKVLLGISSDGREVWAENPTPMQHGFSEEANEVLKTYRRELNLLDSTLVAKRIKLIFRKVSIVPEFIAQFEAIGLDGKRVDRAIARLNSYSELMKSPVKEEDHQDPKPGEAPLQPSADVIEARKAQAAFYEGDDRRAIFAKWRSRLLDPVRYEPTTWGLGAELMMAAENVDRNLVGTVNDGEVGSDELFTKITASQALWKHRESLLPSDDGWIVFRSPERVQRSSRSKAKSLLANCVQQGGITVDLAANWSAQSTDISPFYNWVGSYVCLLSTYAGSYGSLVTMMNDNALRLWTDIGSTGIDSLRHGEVLQLSKLSPAAKTQIEVIVYGYELVDGRDPTDVLPNGITDGTLSMSIDEMPVLIGWTDKDGPPVAPEPLDAKEFGALLANGEPWKEIPAKTYQQYDRFKVGTHRTYKLNLLMEPGAVPMTVQLTETLFNADVPYVTELPAELNSAVEKARLAALATPAQAPPNRAIPPR